MKAFIFNSGTGSRMGDLTKNNPKALVTLANGETILGRQIRLLQDVGIKNIIISTGPFEDQIINETKKFEKINFKFINNEKYYETNNIYSMHLSRFCFDDDFIILHGDLVFDKLIIKLLMESNDKNLCVINTQAKLPEKDFKGKIVNGNLQKISVDIFDEDCYALQPMYKLSQDTINKWLIEINKFINEGKIKVYAENALNNVLPNLNVKYLDYKDCYIEEIDNISDLHRVNKEFRYYDYENQEIIITEDYILELKKYLNKNDCINPLIVHGNHLIKDIKFKELLKSSNYLTFSGFSSNPKYEEVLIGLDTFKKYNCDSIISIGGGSCIDVAKAIKMFSIMDENKHYLSQEPKYNQLKLIAIPTTAGTGTESTRYSVIYYNNEKQSLHHDSLIPDFCILDPHFLYDLPIYHKKASLLDAFCQAIESYWSVNSNNQSKNYSKKALKLILNNYKQYLNNDINVYKDIMVAANYAGRAINITQTTASHAMSYKVTSELGIAHGHAVSLILPEVLKYMINNIDLCLDKRGKVYLLEMFTELADIFSCNNYEDLIRTIDNFLLHFDMEKPSVDLKMIEIFTKSVNKIRLKNNPIEISDRAINDIYRCVFYNN